MYPTRLALVIMLAGLWSARGRVAGAEDAGPSIDEMLSAIEEETSVSETKDAPERPLKKETKRPQQFSAGVTAEVRKIEARASERLAFFRRDGRTWQAVNLYIRLEKFNEAARLLGPMLRTRTVGRTRESYERTRIDKLGEIELVYACLMAYLGRDNIAAGMLAAYRRKLDANYPELLRSELVSRSWLKSWHDPRIAFVKSYAKRKRKVDALEAAAAEEPDAKTLWALVKICDPENNRANLALKYFTTLVDLIMKHPDNPHVRSGSIMWELDEAYRIHQLYEDAIRLIESMPKRFPKDGRVKDGSWLYYLGRRYCDLGRMHEEMRERKTAVQAYRKSLEAFGRMRNEHPKHRYCKERDGEPSELDAWIGNVTRYFRRVGGR